MKPGKQTFFKLCLAVLLLLLVLLGIRQIWSAQHKPADDKQMAASFLPLQNPTLVSGEHGYWSDEEETPELFVVISQSKKKEGEKPHHTKVPRSLYIALTKPASSFDSKTRYLRIMGACPPSFRQLAERASAKTARLSFYYTGRGRAQRPCPSKGSSSPLRVPHKSLWTLFMAGRPFSSYTFKWVWCIVKLRTRWSAPCDLAHSPEKTTRPGGGFLYK